MNDEYSDVEFAMNTQDAGTVLAGKRKDGKVIIQGTLDNYDYYEQVKHFMQYPPIKYDKSSAIYNPLNKPTTKNIEDWFKYYVECKNYGGEKFTLDDLAREVERAPGYIRRISQKMQRRLGNKE